MLPFATILLHDSRHDYRLVVLGGPAGGEIGHGLQDRFEQRGRLQTALFQHGIETLRAELLTRRILHFRNTVRIKNNLIPRNHRLHRFTVFNVRGDAQRQVVGAVEDEQRPVLTALQPRRIMPGRTVLQLPRLRIVIA